jgi:hypothetical protein
MPSRLAVFLLGGSALASFACLDASQPGARTDADTLEADTLAADTLAADTLFERDTETSEPASAFAIEVTFGTTPFDTACLDLRARAGSQTLWSVGDPRFAEDTPRFYERDPDADKSPAAAQAHGALCADKVESAPNPRVAYTGACQAGLEHELTVWIHGVYDRGHGLDKWLSPCSPADGGCTLRARCEAGATTPVRFDLGLARLADQGFFDDAVAFDDIYCSAKVETCYNATAEGGTGDPMKLLFGPDNQRVRTAVLGFACSGQGAGPELVVSDLALTCEQDSDPAPGWQAGSRVLVLDPSLGGNGSVALTGPESSRQRNMLHAWATYRGAEELPGSGKRYWNVALALREDGPSDVAGAMPGNRNCRVTTRMSAFDATWMSLGDGAVLGGFQAASNRAQPYFDVSVRLTDANAAWDCRSVHIKDEDPVGADYDLSTRFDRVSDEAPITYCSKAPGIGDDASAERAPAAECQR